MPLQSCLTLHDSEVNVFSAHGSITLFNQVCLWYMYKSLNCISLLLTLTLPGGFMLFSRRYTRKWFNQKAIHVTLKHMGKDQPMQNHSRSQKGMNRMHNSRTYHYLKKLEVDPFAVKTSFIFKIIRDFKAHNNRRKYTKVWHQVQLRPELYRCLGQHTVLMVSTSNW